MVRSRTISRSGTHSRVSRSAWTFFFCREMQVCGDGYIYIHTRTRRRKHTGDGDRRSTTCDTRKTVATTGGQSDLATVVFVQSQTSSAYMEMLEF